MNRRGFFLSHVSLTRHHLIWESQTERKTNLHLPAARQLSHQVALLPLGGDVWL